MENRSRIVKWTCGRGEEGFGEGKRGNGVGWTRKRMNGGEGVRSVCCRKVRREKDPYQSIKGIISKDGRGRNGLLGRLWYLCLNRSSPPPPS